MFIPFLDKHTIAWGHILLTIRQLKMEKYGNLWGHYTMTTLKETAVAGGYGRLLLDLFKRDVSLSVVFSYPFPPMCSQPTYLWLAHNSSWVHMANTLTQEVIKPYIYLEDCIGMHGNYWCSEKVCIFRQYREI